MNRPQLAPSVPPSTSRTTPSSSLALPAAGVAAGVGGLAWAALMVLSGYEIGWIAWGVGALVGIVTVRAGGRGATTGVMAAGLALLGIGLGKVVGAHVLVGKQLETQLRQQLSPALHRELSADAVAFAELGDAPGEEALRRFVVERRFVSASSADQVDPEELQHFLQFQAPELRTIQATHPSYEEWFARLEKDARAELDATFSPWKAVAGSLNGYDVLFAFLACSTALSMVRRAGAPAARPQAAPGGGALAQDETSERRAA